MPDLKPDDLPYNADLLPQLVDQTCKAVAYYIGLTFGMKLVVLPWDRKSEREIEVAWRALPTASQEVIARIAKRHGYNGMNALLPLNWLTKRQVVARVESILKIAMQAIEDPEWLK